MRAEDELRAVTLVTDRLAARHPEVPRTMIERMVREVHRTFDASPVREFVPLLVERGAHDRLRAEKVHYSLRIVS